MDETPEDLDALNQTMWHAAPARRGTGGPRCSRHAEEKAATADQLAVV